MRSLVVDASVAMKWVLPAHREDLREEAFQILSAYEVGETDLLVPDIFWAECGNILWKAVRQQRLSRGDAETALFSMIRRDIPTVSSAKLLAVAFPIALNFDRSVYDSLYVALAVLEEIDLITADERLANALAAHLPVKWLGAI